MHLNDTTYIDQFSGSRVEVLHNVCIQEKLRNRLCLIDQFRSFLLFVTTGLMDELLDS